MGVGVVADAGGAEVAMVATGMVEVAVGAEGAEEVMIDTAVALRLVVAEAARVTGGKVACLHRSHVVLRRVRLWAALLRHTLRRAILPASTSSCSLLVSLMLLQTPVSLAMSLAGAAAAHVAPV